MASQKKKDQIAELYRQYRHSLLIIAVSYTRSLADAEDLIQSAFTKAILSYESDGSFLFWVNKVMRNEWYSIVRKRQKERSLDGLPEISSPSPDPLEKLIQDDNRRMLAIMIADLPERYRDIMIDYVYLGRNDEQIARFMETAEGTEGFAAQNFYASGTKEGILKLLDSLDVEGVRVVDARLFRG